MGVNNYRKGIFACYITYIVDVLLSMSGDSMFAPGESLWPVYARRRGADAAVRAASLAALPRRPPLPLRAPART